MKLPQIQLNLSHLKKINNKIYPRLLNEVEGKNYYFIDYKNYEW